MNDSISDHFSGLVENIKTYLTAKADLFLLNSFEKIARFQSYLLSSIILILIAFFCLFFITIALAIWIGELLNDQKLGFLVIGGFYFLIGIIFYIFRKHLINRNVIKNLMKILFNDEKNLGL